MVKLFNPNNLVFLKDSYLELARSIDYRVLLGILSAVLFSRLLRSWALWSLGRRYSIKGSYLLTQLPFLSIFLNYRLGKEIGGMGARVRLLFKFGFLLYIIGLVLALIAPTFNLMICGFVLALVPYLLSIPYWGFASIGLTGKESILWYIPIIGSIMMLVSVSKSYGIDIYQRPKNFGTLFKKAEDLEISI